MSTGGGFVGGVGSVGPQVQRPTIGRIVHLYVEATVQNAASGMAGPYAALVVGIPAPDKVNVVWWSQDGLTCTTYRNVLLVQDYEPKPNSGCFCTWPPKV